MKWLHSGQAGKSRKQNIQGGMKKIKGQEGKVKK